jgi:hypothetical protein
MLQIFIKLKNPSPLAGFEPMNLGSNGKHANHYATEDNWGTSTHIHWEEYELSIIWQIWQNITLSIVSWLQTGRPGFDPRQGQRTFPLAYVQTSSQAYPASYPVSTRGPLLWLECSRAMMPTTHLILVLRSRVSKSYTSSPPWHLHGDRMAALLTFTL